MAPIGKISGKGAERLRSHNPLIRPISQILLCLTDRNAYQDAIKESVSWLAKRAQGKIPPSAFRGLPFDLTNQPTANPTEAVEVETEQGKAWAARLSYPDMRTPQRSWVTEIAIKQESGLTLFGARLTNVTRGEDAPYSPSVPGVILQILSKLSAEIDGEPISNEVKTIADMQDLSAFVELAESQNRQLPIVAISVDENDQGIVPESELIKRIGGACHLYKFSPDASWELTRKWDRPWSVFNKAVRIYAPRLNREEDGARRHKLLLPNNNPEWERTLTDLAIEILPRTFENRGEFSHLLRFETIRAKYLASLRKVDQLTGAISRSQVEALENEALRLQQQIEDDSAAANELLNEAARARETAEEDRNSAWAESGRLRARIATLEAALSSGKTNSDAPLEDYQKIEEWCAQHLSGHIIVLPKAIRETRRNGASSVIVKFNDALLLLRDFYVPMRRGIEGYSRIRFDEKCRELGLEESACFSTPGAIKQFPEYSIQYNGQKRWMERHLKFGQGYDLQHMFRIYFYWDDDEQVLVIGNMPTHLDNKLTN